jgi:hypothetical protein
MQKVIFQSEILSTMFSIDTILTLRTLCKSFDMAIRTLSIWSFYFDKLQMEITQIPTIGMPDSIFSRLVWLLELRHRIPLILHRKQPSKLRGWCYREGAVRFFQVFFFHYLNQ